jgi:hypothetical protein
MVIPAYSDKRRHKCLWYYDNACCDYNDMLKIDTWLSDHIQTVFASNKCNSFRRSNIFVGNSPCESFFEVWKCGQSCSPQQHRYMEKRDGVTLFRVCNSFCSEFFEACKHSSVLGFPLEAIYTRYQDFCLAQSEERLRVELDDQNCFDGVVL